MEILYTLLVLLLVARAFGEIAERFGQPALVGELISGMALGIAVNAWADALPILAGLGEDPVFQALTDLGVFFLMLMGGIELLPQELAKASGRSLLVAVCGLLLPLAAGFGLAFCFLPDSEFRVPQCLFVGTAMAITAVPVAIRVLMDIGRLNSPAGSLIVSAALIDDVLSLLLLAILTAVIANGAFPSLGELALLTLNIGFFFAVTTLIGLAVLPRIGRWITWAHQDEFEFSALLLVALGFAVLAEALHLHFILGAFLAGLFFRRRTAGRKVYEDVKQKVSAVTSGFLAPIFFASIGLHMTFGALTESPLFLGLLIVVAFLSKLVGAGVPAYLSGMSRRDACGVGVAMSARGAVELIIADIALRAGLFSKPTPTPPEVTSLFSAIVIMAVVTTIATPIVLRRIYPNDSPGEQPPDVVDPLEAGS